MASDNLQYLIHCLPRIQEAIGLESSIGLADQERYLAVIDGTEMKLNLKAGDPVRLSGTTGDALLKGIKSIRYVDAEVFGIPFMGMGIPLRDEEGKIIGALVVAKSLAIQTNVDNSVNNIKQSVQKITSSTMEIASSSEELSASIGQLSDTIDNIKKEMVLINSVLSLIRDVANQTHLLGLNAAIEASRAGSSGLGFNVVASEIRKLSEQTKGSLKEMGHKISGILNSFEMLSSGISEIASASEEQSSSCMEISESMQKIDEQVLLLKEISSKLLSR